jgi:hypothetical protein
VFAMVYEFQDAASEDSSQDHFKHSLRKGHKINSQMSSRIRRVSFPKLLNDFDEAWYWVDVI